MRTARPIRRTAITAAIVAALVVAVTGPAQAESGAYKTMTCTSSNGYSIAIQGKAKGEVYHMLDSALYLVYKGKFSSAVTRTSNTHIGGTHAAWVNAFDSGSTIGTVSSNSSYCTTY